MKAYRGRPASRRRKLNDLGVALARSALSGCKCMAAAPALRFTLESPKKPHAAYGLVTIPIIHAQSGTLDSRSGFQAYSSFEMTLLPKLESCSSHHHVVRAVHLKWGLAGRQSANWNSSAGRTSRRPIPKRCPAYRTVQNGLDEDDQRSEEIHW